MSIPYSLSRINAYFYSLLNFAVFNMLPMSVTVSRNHARFIPSHPSSVWYAPLLIVVIQWISTAHS
jgi:hypothetical protein